MVSTGSGITYPSCPLNKKICIYQIDGGLTEHCKYYKQKFLWDITGKCGYSNSIDFLIQDKK